MSLSVIRVPGGFQSAVSFGGPARPIGPVFAGCIALWKWQAVHMRPLMARAAASVSLECSE